MSNDQVATYYDRPDVAQKYNDAREGGLRERERRAIQRYFDPGGTVLDVGCGAGRTTTILAELGYDVIGLDISRPMLGLAADADPGVTYLAGDASRLPFADESFRTVLFSHNGLDELRPESVRIQTLREMLRVLEPGGRFAFSGHNILRRLLPIPPTRTWLRKMAAFWRRNVRTIGSAYKYITDDSTLHMTDPLSLVRQVRAVGFDVVDVIGKESPGTALFGTSAFVVCEKPGDNRR